MKVLADENSIEIRFSPAHTLVLYRKARKMKIGRREVPYSEVKGFWKNYRFKGKKKVFYVVLLTGEWMERITPEMDEYDVDEVIKYLRQELGDDKYAR